MLIKALQAIITSNRRNPSTDSVDKYNVAFRDSVKKMIQDGNLREAKDQVTRALKEDDRNVIVLTLAGDIEGIESRAIAAKEFYERAISIDPSYGYAHMGLALIYVDIGKLNDAYLELMAAKRLLPRNADLLANLGMVQNALGNLDAACTALHQALAIDPNHAYAWNNLGISYQGKGALKDAACCFEKAVSKKPDPAMLNNFAMSHRDLNDIQKAEAILADASVKYPDTPEILMNLGLLAYDRGDFAVALKYYNKVLMCEALQDDVCVLLALLYQRLGDDHKALHELQASLSGNSRLQAEQIIGELNLYLGRYSEGWIKYEARLAVKPGPVRIYPYKLWAHESIENKVILVYGEQGLGDEIMFASCIPQLIEMSGKCILHCEPKLANLFAESFPRAIVHGGTANEPLDWLQSMPTPDYYVAIGSLPLRFRTEEDNFPDHVGYLRPNQAKFLGWRSRLAKLGNSPKIGFAWRGGIVKTGMHHRSLQLSLLEPLLEKVNATWIPLQWDANPAEQAELAAKYENKVYSYWEELSDFDSYAALIASLDLIVTVCCTTAHLAGAMGKKTWVMVPKSPAWCYRKEGNEMPWYPSVSLFRQETFNDWLPVLVNIEASIINEFPSFGL